MENNIIRPLFLIGENSDNGFIKKITDRGFDPIILPADTRLPTPTNSHADMLLFLIDKIVFCNKKYFHDNYSIFKKIEEYGYTVNPCEFEVKNAYPYDVSLNQANVGNFIFGNSKACAEEILKYADNHSYSYISTKQGYAKCSTLVLNEKAIITADDSIRNIAKELEIDVLKITNGSNEIQLDGYDYGFIGGASAVYNKTVFFFGNVSLHTNAKEIRAFCENHGFSILSLSNSQLVDVGGAFILPCVKNR